MTPRSARRLFVRHPLLDGLTEGCTMKKAIKRSNTSGLIITHTGHILEYVNADRGQVMYNGKLCCEANPRDILDHISNHGYQECLRCLSAETGEILDLSSFYLKTKNNTEMNLTNFT